MLPELGGAVGRLALKGEDILRPAPANAADPLETACFPLVPFANRIADGRFVFNGRQFILPTVSRFHPHALHGEGWRKPWAIVDIDERSVTTEHHGGDIWPWPYIARQRICLQRRRAVIELSVTNVGEASMPAGLGLHPYFPATPDTRLAFAADGVWLGPPGGIPKAFGKPSDLFDFSGDPRIACAPNIDHCYAGWRGTALIATHARELLITATANASYAQIYMPKGEPFFCFEPVTHCPNALSASVTESTGLVVLAPDASISMSMTLSI